MQREYKSFQELLFSFILLSSHPSMFHNTISLLQLLSIWLSLSTATVFSLHNYQLPLDFAIFLKSQSQIIHGQFDSHIQIDCPFYTGWMRTLDANNLYQFKSFEIQDQNLNYTMKIIFVERSTNIYVCKNQPYQNRLIIWFS